MGRTFPLGDLLGGLVFLAAVLGACGRVAVVLQRRALGHLRGAPRWLAVATLWTAAVCLVHLLPGALGLLSRTAVAGAALTILVAATAASRHTPPSGGADREGTSLVGGALAIAVAACAVAIVARQVGHEPLGQDTTNFQIPVAARWLQTQSLWGLHQWVPDYMSATYPQNGNVLLLATILPFERPFLATLVSPVFYGVCLLAVYALARELRAPRGAAMTAAGAMGAMPQMMDLGLQGAVTDAPAAALLAIGGLFLLRQHRDGHCGELLLAGLALGLAAGTKWYGIPFAMGIAAIWVIARLVQRAHGRRVLADAAALAALGALGGGFWLARNWVRTGNPLFPVDVSPLGVTLFAAPPDRVRETTGFTLLDYAGDLDIWRGFIGPAFAQQFGLPGLALGVGAVAAVVTGWRRRRWDVLAVVAGGVLLALMYAATPYSAWGPPDHPVNLDSSTRYGIPALAGCAAALAWALGQAGRARTPIEAVVAATALAGLAKGLTDVPASTVGLACLAVLAALAAARRLPRGAIVAIAVTTVLIGALVARQRAVDSWYGGADPSYATIERLEPSGGRVAIAGAFAPTGVSPVLPAMGPTLGNRVDRLAATREHYLRRYASAAGLTAALRRGAYDLVLVGRANRPPEEAWVRAAGYEEVVSSPQMVLLRRRDA
jgi:hypothetical protein